MQSDVIAPSHVLGRFWIPSGVLLALEPQHLSPVSSAVPAGRWVDDFLDDGFTNTGRDGSHREETPGNTARSTARLHNGRRTSLKNIPLVAGSAWRVVSPRSTPLMLVNVDSPEASSAQLKHGLGTPAVACGVCRCQCGLGHWKGSSLTALFSSAGELPHSKLSRPCHPQLRVVAQHPSRRLRREPARNGVRSRPTDVPTSRGMHVCLIVGQNGLGAAWRTSSQRSKT